MNAGTRLGPYEIISRIGAGGMGEVWQANDTRLGRAVAIKVLTAEFAANAELRTRFEREAKTISLLNHPNICTLFDVGENYLVMELLEGETLADRLSRGPLSLEEVFRYGVQIADALAKAHKHGVVHRDLKPANVMITRAGAKLLDFGLAKTAVVAISHDGATEHRPLTQEGTILGTFQYMAPEQLEGAAVDHRTDIFAFGALLYEMVTGKRAFDGKTKTSLIAAIVAAEPRPLSEMRPLAPAALGHVIEKCLAKDPEERWQSAHDVAEELRWIGEAGSQAGVAARAPGKGRVSRRVWIAVALAGWVVGLAGAAAVWSLRSQLDRAQRPIRAEISPPPGFVVSRVNEGPVALSPDGTRLVFTGSLEGEGRLWIRSLSTGVTIGLDGTDGAIFPFWSPDGGSIGFFAAGQLKIVGAGGGGVRAVCDAPVGRGGTWNRDDVIVFAPDVSTGLVRVSADGGTPVRLTTTRTERGTHRFPYFLADGKTFLFVAGDEVDAAVGIFAGSLTGETPRRVLDGGSNMAVHDGRLVFYRGGNLFAQPFDEKSATVRGTPLPIAEDVEFFPPRYSANFAVSRTGVLVYRSSASRLVTPTWYSSDGMRQEAAAAPGYYRIAELSRDGKRILYSRTDYATGAEELWIADSGRSAMTRVTFDSKPLIHGTFSPDGAKLAVSAVVGVAVPMPEVWIQPVMGGPRRVIYRGTELFQVLDWTADGSLVGTTQRNRTAFDIGIMNAETGKIRLILTGTYNEFQLDVSPDGKWLAYQSDESGRPEVYVTTFPDPGAKWQVSAEGGVRPFWSHDGQTLYFGSRRHLVSVGVRATSGSLDFGPPRVLPTDELGSFVPRAVSPDGRLLMLQAPAQATPFTLVTNWTNGLNR